MTQQYIINKLIQEYQDDIKNLPCKDIPLASHESIVTVKEEENLLNEADQKRYQCGFVTMIYLTKFSRP